MRLEIKSASQFLTNLLKLGNSLNNPQLELFSSKLEEMLRHHYQQHWFPEKPCKGSGYRCLRINHKMDPIIAKAGMACGLDEASLRQLFPNELTLWIDPREVSYRIGENGSICVLYECSKSSTSNLSMSSAVECWEKITHPTNNNSPSPNTYKRYPRPGCKESLRGSNSWDSYIMDPRNVNLEKLAAYVSS